MNLITFLRSSQLNLCSLRGCGPLRLFEEKTGKEMILGKGKEGNTHKPKLNISQLNSHFIN